MPFSGCRTTGAKCLKGVAKVSRHVKRLKNNNKIASGALSQQIGQIYTPLELLPLMPLVGLGVILTPPLSPENRATARQFLPERGDKASRLTHRASDSAETAPRQIHRPQAFQQQTKEARNEQSH